MLVPELQYDMVRPGIGLYGTGVPEMADQLRYGQTLVTRPIRLQRIAAGDTVGYGRTFRADRDMRVATLPVGYADGLNRGLSGKGFVLIRGQRAPILGRVCMDQTMVDVSHIPGVAREDEAVILGRSGALCQTADDLAETLDTIGYEIVCGISPRVRRVYFTDSENNQ